MVDWQAPRQPGLLGLPRKAQTQENQPRDPQDAMMDPQDQASSNKPLSMKERLSMRMQGRNRLAGAKEAQEAAKPKEPEP